MSKALPSAGLLFVRQAGANNDSLGCRVPRRYAGPAIRLVEAREDALQGLVVSVVSLQRARAVLQTRNMMDSDSREVIIRSPRLDGLVIRLVQDK